MLSVFQDCGRVTKAEDLVEPVADVEDELASLLLLADEPHELVDSRRVQGGRRLVVDDDGGLGRRALGDLDEMLLRDGKIAARDVGAEIDADMIEHCAGSPPHRGPVDKTVSPRLSAKENVLSDGQVGKQRQFLKDCGDARPASVRRAAAAHLATHERDLAEVGRINTGEQLHQRRFPCAILSGDRMHGPCEPRKGNRRKRLDRTEQCCDIAELNRGSPRRGRRGTRDSRRRERHRNLPVRECG